MAVIFAAEILFVGFAGSWAVTGLFHWPLAVMYGLNVIALFIAIGVAIEVFRVSYQAECDESLMRPLTPPPDETIRPKT